MKRALGIDYSGSWTFTPGAAGVGTIAFSGVTIPLKSILLITNVTRGVVIFQFNSATKGAASYSNGVLTLEADTSTHSASDELHIRVDVDAPTMVDAAPQSGLAMLLTRILAAMLAPLGYRKDTQRYQASAVIESGTVTTVSTVTSVTNAVPVGNVATLGSLSADRLINSANWSAWADCHRSRIT